MLHSVESYTKRESTEKLQSFLKDYYEGKLTEDFSLVIPLVEEELRQRKDNEATNNC